MDWNEFERSVREGRFERVYIFTGPEEWNKRAALETLRRAILPSGLEQLNEQTIDHCGAQEIIDAAETLPVMCDRRLVVVRDWPPLLAGRSKSEEADAQRMLEYLQDPPQTAAIVFWLSKESEERRESEERKRSEGGKGNPCRKLQDALKKMNGMMVFNRLQGKALSEWCAEQLKPTGKKLQTRALEEMVEMAGSDLTRLSGELAKLAAYVGNASEIKAEDVRKIVVPTPEYRAYEILDRLLTGRLAEATEVVNSVLLGDMNCVRLIVLLANSLRINAHAKLAVESGQNVNAVLAAMGVSGGRTYFIKRQIRLLSAAAFTERYLCCTRAQFDITSGRLRDRAALDALLLEIVV